MNVKREHLYRNENDILGECVKESLGLFNLAMDISAYLGIPGNIIGVRDWLAIIVIMTAIFWLSFLIFIDDFYVPCFPSGCARRRQAGVKSMSYFRELTLSPTHPTRYLLLKKGFGLWYVHCNWYKVVVSAVAIFRVTLFMATGFDGAM